MDLGAAGARLHRCTNAHTHAIDAHTNAHSRQCSSLAASMLSLLCAVYYMRTHIRWCGFPPSRALQQTDTVTLVEHNRETGRHLEEAGSRLVPTPPAMMSVSFPLSIFFPLSFSRSRSHLFARTPPFLARSFTRACARALSLPHWFHRTLARHVFLRFAFSSCRSLMHCLHAHTHTRTRSHAYTHARTCTHAHTRARTHTRARADICIDLCTCMYDTRNDPCNTHTPCMCSSPSLPSSYAPSHVLSRPAITGQETTLSLSSMPGCGKGRSYPRREGL